MTTPLTRRSFVLSILSCAFTGIALTLSSASCASAPAPESSGRSVATELKNERAPSSKDPRIFFIGNSLTGYNNLPGLFRYLANQNGESPTVSTSLKFGQPLDVHFADAAVRDALTKTKWDSVVLQEYSDLPLVNRAAFLQHVTDFKNLLAPTGATILLFENWPYTTAAPGTMQQLDAAYAEAAKITQGPVIRLGDAFDSVVHHSSIPMYAKDDVKHPSPIATYMNTLIFLKYFFALDPAKVAHQGSTTNTPDKFLGDASAPPIINLETIYSASDLAFVQAAATALPAGF